MQGVYHPECNDKVPATYYPTKDIPGKKEGYIECYVENEEQK